MERMKKAGRDMSPSDANAIAKDSKALLRQRLHIGGQHMPPPTLSESEIRCLVPYLEQLSEVHGTGNQQLTVKESAYRVGEPRKIHRHVCHNAVGPNPVLMLEGQFPALPPPGDICGAIMEALRPRPTEAGCPSIPT
jgi:hypothetical protein